MSALNKKQIQSLRKQLDQREAQLHEEIRWADADRAEAPAHHPREQVEDSGEYSEQHTREVVSDAETERDHEELQEIAAAKERMLQGGYGQCMDCDMAIPLARLQARPASVRCLGCQADFEKSRPLRTRIGPTP
ncbi:MAG TPA: TraR/DksA family transcriptional regulator [Rhizobacter sp.]|nr:TraR/DksA family transcriptional regulator [Rhizobacter sp.]